MSRKHVHRAKLPPIHVLMGEWSDMAYDERQSIFWNLSSKKRLSLLPKLHTNEQEELLTAMPLTNMAALLTEIGPDDLVDIIQAVSSEVRERVWRSLPKKIQEETRLLLRYDQEEAAGVMSSRYLAIRADLTVKQALDFIRSSGGSSETIYYVYIVDNLQRLIGVVSLRQILTASDSSNVREIMVTDVVTVNTETDQEEAAKILSTYDLIALPVCDAIGRILGIITFDDVIKVIRREQTEDVYRMGAIQPDTHAYLRASVPRLVLRRVPWLIILLCFGTITTNLISSFSGLLAGALFLVWFIPVITQTGGNSGTQSATLIIRGLAIGEVHWRNFWNVIIKETAVGLLMGIILAGMLLLRGLFLPPMLTFLPAVAIAAALAAVVLLSSLIGALFPLIISKLGYDPTVMAAPLMATVIDFFGIALYFIITRAILQI